MNSNLRKDSFLNSAVLFAAWLVIIVASAGNQVESTTGVVRIAYAAE